jgi:demethylmenaquinone methyltransferase/2-methoxy-6-polyprenyl-1,4-benzoquinol methylase
MKSPLEQVTKKREITKTYYDHLSRWYDLLAGRAENKCKEIGLKLLNVQPGETVLEIGFGTGQCLLALAQSTGDTGKIYGIDISEGMLQVAQSRLRNARLAERVELRQGDATQLPFEDGVFDALYMSFTLELFDPLEIPLLLIECQRVLRLNGRMCVVAMSRRDKPGFMGILYDWGHRKWPLYIDCRRILVHHEIEKVDFQIESALQTSVFGLPVDIVLAMKRPGENNRSLNH